MAQTLLLTLAEEQVPNPPPINGVDASTLPSSRTGALWESQLLMKDNEIDENINAIAGLVKALTVRGGLRLELRSKRERFTVTLKEWKMENDEWEKVRCSLMSTSEVSTWSIQKRKFCSVDPRIVEVGILLRGAGFVNGQQINKQTKHHPLHMDLHTAQ